MLWGFPRVGLSKNCGAGPYIEWIGFIAIIIYLSVSIAVSPYISYIPCCKYVHYHVIKHMTIVQTVID